MKKLISVLAAAVVVFAVLSVSTSWYSLDKAKSAISQIGTVSLNSESKNEIDQATTYYDSLSVGIGASTYFHDQINEYVDYPKLQKAQSEYATAAIEHAVTLSQEPDSFDEALNDSIAQAREVMDTYFPNKDYSTVENYQQLVELENS